MNIYKVQIECSMEEQFYDRRIGAILSGIGFNYCRLSYHVFSTICYNTYAVAGTSEQLLMLALKVNILSKVQCKENLENYNNWTLAEQRALVYN